MGGLVQRFSVRGGEGTDGLGGRLRLARPGERGSACLLGAGGTSVRLKSAAHTVLMPPAPALVGTLSKALTWKQFQSPHPEI